MSGGGRGRKSGYVLVTTAVLLTVLLAFAGLAIDVGYVEYTKRCAQTAADSAALAGALEIRAGRRAADAVHSALDAAGLNGFNNGANGVTVTVHTPPAAGPYTGDATAVEVLVAQVTDTFFMRALGMRSSTVRARAVGRLGSMRTCIQALNPHASGALSVAGSSKLQVDCGIVVDSDISPIYTNGTKACVSAGSVRVVAGDAGGGCVSPAPETGIDYQPDPLAYLQGLAPDPGTCSSYSPTTISGGAGYHGLYCGGLIIDGTVTLEAGTYILHGGGLTVKGNARLSGSGVAFYQVGASGTGLSVGGNSSVQLSAPTSGSLAGILYFQDPSATSPNSVNGTANLRVDGALYFPKSSLQFKGSSSDHGYTVVVADTVMFSGSSTLNADYSSLPNGSPMKAGAVLAE